MLKCKTVLPFQNYEILRIGGFNMPRQSHFGNLATINKEVDTTWRLNNNNAPMASTPEQPETMGFPPSPFHCYCFADSP